MTGPDIKPKLKRGKTREGVDTYTANLQGGKDYFVTIERDGDEWVRLNWEGKPERWYSTLAEFRRYIADVNVSRWTQKRFTDSSEDADASKRFRAWAKRRVPGQKCQGVRTMRIPGFGVSEVHDGCCNHVIGKPLPEGLTLLDLYEEWAAKQEQ